MAKKARPQSEQERNIDHEKDSHEGFDSKKHIAVSWKARDLRRGDRIVTALNKNGGIFKSYLVKEIEHEPRGCKNKVHVNGEDCYDYAGNELLIALHGH